MHALIGVDLVRNLPARHVDIRDTRLPGFAIRCRASGVHSYLVLLGRRRVMTLGKVSVLTPHEARKAARLALADMAHGIDPTAGRRRGAPSWAAFLTDTYQPWATEHRKTGAETVARLQSRFADFDALPLTSISAFTVERWRTARLKAGVKPSTTNRDLVALRSALSKALAWGFLKVHPLATVKAAHVDTIGHVRFLSAEEDLRLRAALDTRDDRRRIARDAANIWRRDRGYPDLPAYGRFSDHLTPLVLLALGTGCRRGELFDLRWRDVDLPGRRLTVRGASAKSGSSRVIPLNTDVVDVLQAWQPTPASASALVFPNRDGAQLRDIKTSWSALLTKAAIKTRICRQSTPPPPSRNSSSPAEDNARPSTASVQGETDPPHPAGGAHLHLTSTHPGLRYNR
jgi:integrase